MRRIQPPVCTCCNKANAIFESCVWPSVRLCGICHRGVVEFTIVNTGVIHGNPFLLEMAGGIDNGDDDESIRIWRERPNQSSTYYEFRVKRESDSLKLFENPLDILDGIMEN